MLRDAVAADCPRLTEIAFSAKRHWGYPEACFRIWEKELTVNDEYLTKARVRSEELDGGLVGFYSILENPAPFRIGEREIGHEFILDHMFIDPEWHGRGIGRAFFRDIDDFLAVRGVGGMCIFVDPHAAGFYEKMGARRICDFPSNIPGRMIPVYGYSPKQD